MGGSEASGSENFVFAGRQVPSVMLVLAAGHLRLHPMVRLDEKALPTEYAVYAYMAVRRPEKN